ncbi:unnamed protein product [Linum tenue]|uniref:Uncharacterized protein n=1 Tax=Linum tenue TaxID=586396 RepID=A0AAV0Q540_9ROSI|nr:unnamed protein product [Linum tenue]
MTMSTRGATTAASATLWKSINKQIWILKTKLGSRDGSVGASYVEGCPSSCSGATQISNRGIQLNSCDNRALVFDARGT